VDNLVLIRVAATYARSLPGAVVRDFLEDSEHRFRLVFVSEAGLRSVAISVDPSGPWTGRPFGRGRPKRRDPGRFAATLARKLRGAVLREVAKPHAERRVVFGFLDGRALVAELVPHRSDLILLDSSGAVITAARRRRRDRARLAAGRVYEPPPMPPGRTDPFSCREGEVEALLRGRGPDAVRDLMGIGPVAARLASEEARRAGIDLASHLVQRLGELAGGRLDPVIVATADPSELAREGRLDERNCRLLPWMPAWEPEPGFDRLAGDDASATAGWFHGAWDGARTGRLRTASLRSILEREARRLREVEAKVAADLEAFEDPERFRHAAEALLAGLKVARRFGDHVMVPDPYDAEGRLMPVAVPPGETPARAAESYFARHRRARRGLERARERATEVAARRGRLEGLQQRFTGAEGAVAGEALERAMQHEGIPVGLERLGRPVSPAGGGRGRARLEGVRMFLSRDGDPVLVGKSGQDNLRLTFKLASPEDFWFHALGVPGAHVVVRNDRRRKQPSASTLTEAAAAAAWFSEARDQPQADVQWTRRKYVRKVRGTPSGAVRVKRFETVRVRPRLPGALEGRS